MGYKIVNKSSGLLGIDNMSKNFIDSSDFEWIKQYAEIKDGDYDVILFHYPVLSLRRCRGD